MNLDFFSFKTDSKLAAMIGPLRGHRILESSVMLLMIDNYDSFTYNVVQYLGELGADVQVFRNDAISVAEIEKLDPAQIVISPGPCTPNEAGISMEVISHFAGKKPILGICLGHQSIVEYLSREVVPKLSREPFARMVGYQKFIWFPFCSSRLNPQDP